MKLRLYGKATIVACIQYDVCKNINDVFKAVRSEHKHCLQTQLQSQGAILSFVLDHSLSVTKSIWTSVQSKMPKNIQLCNKVPNLKNSLIPSFE